MLRVLAVRTIVMAWFVVWVTGCCGGNDDAEKRKQPGSIATTKSTPSAANKPATNPTAKPTAPATTAAPKASATAAPSADPVTLKWEITKTPRKPDKTSDSETISKIALIATGSVNQRVEAGTFPEDCNISDPAQWTKNGKNDPPPTGASIRCWWAGAGDEIAVFVDKGQIEVKKQEIAEEGLGKRTIIATVKLPAGAKVNAPTAH